MCLLTKYVLIFLASCLVANAQELSYKSQLMQAQSKFNSIRNVRYKMLYCMSNSNRAFIPARIDCTVKNAGMDANNIRFNIVYNDSIQYCYDGKLLNIVNHNDRKILQVDVNKYGFEHYFGNTISYYTWEPITKLYHLHNDPNYTSGLLQQILEGNYQVTEEKDTVISGQEIRLISYNNDDPAGKLSISSVIGIRTMDSVPIFQINNYSNKYYWQQDTTVVEYIETNAAIDENEFDINKYQYDNVLYIPRKKLDLVAAGNNCPQWQGSDSNGRHVSSRDYEDKVVLLYFGYMACIPCKKMLPVVLSVHNKYNATGLSVVYLNAVDKANEKFKKYVEQNNMLFPCVMVSGDVASQFGVEGYPSYFLVDKNNVVVYSESGFDNEHTAKALIDNIEIALSDK